MRQVKFIAAAILLKFYLSNALSSKPTLVVGATGQVGRLVVQQLLAAKKPVRALVRDEAKAKEIFSSSVQSSPDLDIIVCDLGKYQNADESSKIEKAIDGVEAIISVSGTMRFSKLQDFSPPWKLLDEDVTSWCDDTSHPYYTNYKAQCLMIDLAAKQNPPPKFVRLTGLSTGFSTFNLFTLIFSSLLSLSSRYHHLCEQYLKMQSEVPYVILRPGGLADEERDVESTYLQVEPSGYLPPPGRIPRADVAALAVQSVDASIVPKDSRYTLGIRAVGEMKPKPQGEKKEGFATEKECLQNLVQTTPSEKVLATKEEKPYGIAVPLFVYSIAIVGFKISTSLIKALLGLF